MATFIRLEYATGGNAVDVNIDSIETFHKSADTHVTAIRFVSGTSINVKQSPDDIRLLIKQGEPYRSS